MHWNECIEVISLEAYASIGKCLNSEGIAPESDAIKRCNYFLELIDVRLNQYLRRKVVHTNALAENLLVGKLLLKCSGKLSLFQKRKCSPKVIRFQKTKYA